MKIFDIHVHVGKKDHLIPRMVTHLEQNWGPDTLKLLDVITPESLEKFLGNESVDMAVILADYSPLVTGIVPNDYVSNFSIGSKKLLFFGGIDFDSDVEPAAQLESLVQTLGCKGLKLLPSYAHFYPDDERLMPVYETAQSFGIPVMFHTGSSLFPGTRIKYAHPLLLEGVAEQFSNLPIIMSHGGRPFWYKEAEWMLRRNSNVYIDVSGIPAAQLTMHFPKMEQYRDRFMFGSDWPNVPSIHTQVSKILKLKLSRECLENLLWNNAVRLLKCEDKT